MKNENFITIQGWMVNELGLSGNELICFALIYGFSQNEESEFSGSLSYVAESLNMTKENARKVLLRLVEKGLVNGHGEVTHGIKLCHYSVNKETAMGWLKQQRCMAKTAMNNIGEKEENLCFVVETQPECENPKEERNIASKCDALFEECWKEYKRKGHKNKAKPYWDKLSQDERERILPHIKAYVSTRERSYQQDFERYLRDKTYDTVVYERNSVIYDPEMFTNNEYRPFLGENIFWDKTRNIHVFFGDVETLYDGYTSENRPNEAKVFQNGYTFVWDSAVKQWIKQ